MITAYTLSSFELGNPMASFAIDLSDWPKDVSGRYLCTKEKPMPEDASGQWTHTNVKGDGGCDEGCCDDYVCIDCGVKWRVGG